MQSEKTEHCLPALTPKYHSSINCENGKSCIYCTVTDLKIDWEELDLEDDRTYCHLVDLTNGGKFPLRGFRFKMGRCPSNQIEVKDTAASRLHAMITWQDGEFFIDDLGSTNGTYVNADAVVKRSRLTNGDTIKIGRTIYAFVQGDTDGQDETELLFNQS